MQYREAGPGDPLISGLTREVQDDRCTLRWHWPEGVQAVYIARSSTGQDGGVDERESPLARARLYTKAEYKVNKGYHMRIDGFGRYEYTVYPCLENESSARVLIVQTDGANTTEISAGKAKIYYSVKQRSGFLKKTKTVQIQVTAEVSIDKDVLCYVKKEDGYPTNKEDGIRYSFVAPFAAGTNTLPAIEVGKRDFIRLFFTDGPTYGQMYELISQ
ncbi:beta-mannanase [Paenibacillaceae bacterium]|nr:beta-mannanase [Paenibacillaceae bacterium]